MPTDSNSILTNNLTPPQGSLAPFNPTLDPETLRISSGAFLPHWQCHHAIYHISFRLADSVPQSIYLKWVSEREFLLKEASQLDKEAAQEKIRQAQFLYSNRTERYLDMSYGKCYLKETEIAKLVAQAFTYFNNVRYHLHAWCIMPNHVHVIVQIMPNYDLSKIMHSWKSYTSHKANNLLGRTGPFWQLDGYNHIIRSEREYHHQIQYTWNNPEKAGIQNWPWRWRCEIGSSLNLS